MSAPVTAVGETIFPKRETTMSAGDGAGDLEAFSMNPTDRDRELAAELADRLLPDCHCHYGCDQNGPDSQEGQSHADLPLEHWCPNAKSIAAVMAQPRAEGEFGRAPWVIGQTVQHDHLGAGTITALRSTTWNLDIEWANGMRSFAVPSSELAPGGHLSAAAPPSEPSPAKLDERQLEDWKNDHAEAVHADIAALDRRAAESMARAPSIAVSNAATPPPAAWVPRVGAVDALKSLQPNDAEVIRAMAVSPRNEDTRKALELTYAATARCACGAGLAYRPGDTSWGCSAMLLGPGEVDGYQHPRFPFVFYEIKSEKQPSANGATTRGPLVSAASSTLDAALATAGGSGGK